MQAPVAQEVCGVQKKINIMDKIQEILRLLPDTNHLSVYIILEPEGTFGLSTLQMPTVEEIWQESGTVMLRMRGQENPIKIDEYSDCIDQIYKYLEEHKYDNLSDEVLQEIFDDLETDRIVEEYKSGILE